MARISNRFVALLLFAACALVLSGCAQGGTPTSGASSDSTGARLLKGRVTYVVDGDTAHVDVEGRGEEKVRFIGIDTPEATKQVEPFGREATNYARKLLDGKTVWLELDAEQRDRYGRLLAYVWLEQPAEADSARRASDAEMRASMYNARVALDGLASQMTIPPNVKYADRFRTYVREARDANRGLWGSGGSSAPVPEAEPAFAPSNAQGSFVGNSNSRKLHVAGCTSVGDTKVEHRVTFATREAAVAAGYRPCGRCNP